MNGKLINNQMHKMPLQCTFNLRTLRKRQVKGLDGNYTRMLCEAAADKTPAAWPLTSHLINHPNKLCKTSWSC